MSPTKQAKSQGNSCKEPKLHQCQNGEINLRRNQAQSGASSPLANERSVNDYDPGIITGQVRLDQNIQNINPVHLVGSRSHHTGMETRLWRSEILWMQVYLTFRHLQGQLLSLSIGALKVMNEVMLAGF